MSEHTQSGPAAGNPPDALVDACGLACPMPLLKAKQSLARLADGQLVEVRATDAGSWRDMASFTALSDHVLEGREQRGDVYYYWIRKAPGGAR
ncbi:MAG: sulfurtransferase TusA family protein [Halomonas subglaciescola]|nr:sulfurtransferase TusA family protein [Halomonas subglaciescola]